MLPTDAEHIEQTPVSTNDQIETVALAVDTQIVETVEEVQ